LRIEVAIAWNADNDWKSVGWVNLDPQECRQRVFLGNLGNRHF
jgi:uncharacterized membrane protein